MVAGRVVRFDSARGYGFIAPEEGEEDVFLHVNDLLIPESSVRAGLAVEFEVEEGDRGPKASSIRLAEGAQSPTAAPGRPAGEAIATRAVNGDEPMCDVLRADEFTTEVTEVLLHVTPSLTGAQITHIRRELTQYARKHGWVEG
ncbi:cold shock domain-containing protein [Streptomyces canus]|uniref:cold-shock protein n=1 Tax=Streptomyces canus TaxID=58343 RepID=UPI002E2AF650|nr:cold shock domain-containing protein [Streptomyces canus]